MLAGELARQRVEAAHALDRDQEGLFSGQAGLGQRRQLVAQMPLELLDVGAVKGLAAAQILPPLRDLLLERSIGEGRHAVHACIQSPRRVLSTTCHCCRCAVELRPAFSRDPVVLAPAAVFGRGPLRRDETLALEPVEHGIEHAVGPLQVPARQLGHSLDDGVAVAVAFGKDGEHERRGGRRNQVLAHVHT